MFLISWFGRQGFLEGRRASFLKYSPISSQTLCSWAPIISQHTPRLICFESLVDMSQTKNVPSSQGILNNDKRSLTSKADHDDKASTNAEKPNQHKDTEQRNRQNPQSTSKEAAAATTGLTPSPRSKKEKTHNASEASTFAGTKQSVCPCEPCECRELKCDGVRPMCNNCGMNGRRCSYE